jgi:hypothetical protein
LSNQSGTSCYHLVTRLMTVTDLLRVFLTRLIQAVRNKLLRACCHQLVNNLLHDILCVCFDVMYSGEYNVFDVSLSIINIRLVTSLLASSTLLQDGNNLFQTCQQLGTISANTTC